MFGTTKAKELKKDGLLLKDIPKSERTERLCKIAIKQNPMAIKYTPDTYLTYKICLEAVKKNRYVLKYVPSRFVNRKMCKLAVGDNECLQFISKRYDYEKKLFFSTFKVVDDQKPFRTLVEGKAEFSDFDDFYNFLNSDLMGAELRDYDFNGVSLKNYNINGAVIHNEILSRQGLYDSSYFDLISSRINATENITKNEIAIPDDFKYIGPVNSGKYTEYDENHFPIFYISDIHLEHRIFNHFKDKATKEEIYSYVKYLAKKLVLSIGKIPNNSYLLIAGDTAFTFDLSKVFFSELAHWWIILTSHWCKTDNIIVISGNHELRDPYIDLENNIIEYRNFFKKIGMIFLQNDLYFAEYKNNFAFRFDGQENKSGIIYEEQLRKWSKDKIQGCVRQSSIVVLGRVGFSGLNPKYNATIIPYGKSFDELPSDDARLEKDIKEAKRFSSVYNKVLDALSGHRVIILTHTDKSDWSSIPYNKNWIYLNGHTHHNFIDISDERTVYANNQIGYRSNNVGLKYFYLDNDYDVFANYEDGIHQITKTQFVEFHLGKNINTQYNRDDGTFYMLKRKGIYMFFICKYHKKSKRERLYLMSGGNNYKLERDQLTDLEYYYRNLEKYKYSVDQLLHKYTERQKKIASCIRKLGGYAKIHGCIIDIGDSFGSSFTHLYVNPSDGKITPYFALDTSSRVIFENFKALLRSNPFCRKMYENYLRLENESKSDLPVIQLDNDLNRPDFLYNEGSYPYKISRIIRSLQYCSEKNIIRNWNENLLDDDFIARIKQANTLEDLANENLMIDKIPNE